MRPAANLLMASLNTPSHAWRVRMRPTELPTALRTMLPTVLSAVLPALAWNTAHGQRAEDEPLHPPNLLLIIADDLGVETLPSYGIGSPTAVTPNLDRLAARGMRFENFWAAPTCTPSRAQIVSGRHAFRTGVRLPVFPHPQRLDLEESPLPPPAGSNREIMFTPLGVAPLGGGGAPPAQGDGDGDAVLQAVRLPPGLPLSERALPAVLKDGNPDYVTGGFGKWHLNSSNNGYLDHPNLAGFDHYSGIPFGSPESFFSWRHNTNGAASVERGYTDQRIVADAIAWISAQHRPWFAWVGLANPHVPEHLPPTHLLASSARSLDPDALTPENTQPYFLARIEAMDTLVGQLLAGIPQQAMSRTYVLFVSDNGSVNWSDPPWPTPADRAKGTIYQGGIHVPFIAAGPGIEPGSAETALAGVVDLFATLLELAGVDVRDAVGDDRAMDSRSLAALLHGDPGAPRREFLYMENRFGGVASEALRNDRHKLIRMSGAEGEREELYDLWRDPYEENDLLAAPDVGAAQIRHALAEEIRRLKGK